MVDAGQASKPRRWLTAITAMEMDLEVVPVLNKIDLARSRSERVAEEIEDIVVLMPPMRCAVSAKTGVGVPDCWSAWCAIFRRRKAIRKRSLQALIIDSWFDTTSASFLWCVSKTAPCAKAIKLSDEYRQCIRRSPGHLHAEAGGPYRAEMRRGSWLVFAIKTSLARRSAIR